MGDQSSAPTDGNQISSKQRKKNWNKRISDWKASGLSKAAFCRRENIDLNVFYYWSLKAAKSKKSSTLKLLPVKVEKDVLSSGQLFQASLPNGVKIKFSLPANTNDLLKLIQGLCHATSD